MTQPNTDLLPENPLSKIPTLVLADGTVLIIFVVICEYLDTLAGGRHPVPALRARSVGRPSTALNALGNGLLDFLFLWRHERERSAPLQRCWTPSL